MENYMKIAIDLAKTTKGQTSPNPVVGAVIVKDNQIVGLGAHLKAGEPHAERHALKMAGEKARGATLYVTLEPCSHFGRTPPCADAVIEAGISKVIIASMDPNPQVAGNGVKKLEEADIDVAVGVMKEEADDLNQVFFHYIKTQQPFVTLKSATSLDGKIATTTGESKWITSQEARQDAHELRHKHDAILVGVNTVLCDNPSLTTRIVGGGKQPIRIVLDRHLKTPTTAKLITDQEAPTWIITTSLAEQNKVSEFQQLGINVIAFPGEQISISELLKYLGKEGIASLLVEGGGTINDAFLRADSFQQIVAYIAPTIIGGKDSLSSFAGLGISHLSNAPKLHLDSVDRVGVDIKLTYRKG